MNTEENGYIDLLIPDDFKELDRFLDENGYEHGYDEAYDTFLIGGGDGIMYTVECTYDDSNPYYALYRGDECVFEPNFLERLKDYILETIPSSADKEEDGYEYDSVYGKDVNEALDILKTAGYIVEADKKHVEYTLLDDNWLPIHKKLKQSEILYQFTSFSQTHAADGTNYYHIVLPVKNIYGLTYRNGDPIHIIWIDVALRFTGMNYDRMEIFGDVSNVGYMDLTYDGYQKSYDNAKFKETIDLEYNDNVIQNIDDIVLAIETIVESIKDNLKKEHDDLSESVISESVNIPPYYIELARKILEAEEHWTQATDEEVKEWLDDEYDGGRKGKIFWKAYCDAFKHEEDDYKCVRLALDAVFDDEENMLMHAEVGVL